ncbi:phosphatase PAP2 family protein [Stutzerimonas decontaminans]|uniref:Phosphatase PAP2 family protein n=1 Tax=Stutzerimonas decontaminans TaxID=3022791 RepID=A0ABX4W2R1_9GAMM|nr:phosphatase PAP2 family protein [Stutzerimonas decontaminans]MCQ4245339.1 phosphatase PAP2 family protein [Stutzerimonas decontaminans]MCW8154958.1 phosphatase PAP2 family protein [Stutzerimonas stutzeri]PNF85911.1 phosphatase PAP2 family protein [Stutzerimonas decontaminans]
MPALPDRSGQSRPFNFALGFGVPAILMLALLIGDPTQLDFAFSRLFYEPGVGFVGRHSWLLEDFLHDRVKQAVIAIGVLAIAGFLLSLLPTRLARWRRPLGYLVLALGISTSIVTPLKTLTGVHCPWSLTDFGGSETFTSLLAERVPTLKPGRCWPGGHASAGFSLLALFFVLRDPRPRLARYALGLALGLGLILSLGRVMQGAHFLSHNLWTLLFDWTICLACYRLLLYRTAEQPITLAEPAI